MARKWEWNEEEKTRLTQTWKTKTTREISQELHRSPGAIRAMATKMQLGKKPEHLQRRQPPTYRKPERIEDIKENTRSTLQTIILNQYKAGFLREASK